MNYEVKLVEHEHDLMFRDWEPVYDWLVTNIGYCDKWVIVGESIYFSTDSDAMWFSLSWSKC